MKRRQFLAWSLAGAGITLGSGFWRSVFAQCAPGESRYGPLQDPDANGLMLPQGFVSRKIATTGEFVGNTLYPWHALPDGGACFPMADGGWAYTSNAEAPIPLGGASMVRFNAAGEIVDARSILTGVTNVNCAGGPTPWGTWLSCEEHDLGHVWECPLDVYAPVVRLGLGTFTHEAATVDPLGRSVYMTEDEPDGRFYRFVSDAWPDLNLGRLFAARVKWDDANERAGEVRWRQVNSGLSARYWPEAEHTTPFDGGEGCWYDGGFVYFTTKGDNRVWSYDTARRRLEVIYDGSGPLRGVDNVVVSRSGDIYVAEDGDNMQICLITPERVVSPFLQLTGHDGSEITGPAFSPDSPDGIRLYFSSQRGPQNDNPLKRGVTFEVSGPFC
jgi:uncharacterized protein